MYNALYIGHRVLSYVQYRHVIHRQSFILTVEALLNSKLGKQVYTDLENNIRELLGRTSNEIVYALKGLYRLK